MKLPSTVNFIDKAIDHISTDTALQEEFCIAIGENQLNAIKKNYVYTEGLMLKFQILVGRPTKKLYKNRRRLAVCLIFLCVTQTVI